MALYDTSQVSRSFFQLPQHSVPEALLFEMYKQHYKEAAEGLGHIFQISRVDSLQITEIEISYWPWLLRLSKQHFLTEEQPHSFSPARAASDSLDNLEPSHFQIFFCFRQIDIYCISVSPFPCQALLLFLRGPTNSNCFDGHFYFDFLTFSGCKTQSLKSLYE